MSKLDAQEELQKYRKRWNQQVKGFWSQIRSAITKEQLEQDVDETGISLGSGWDTGIDLNANTLVNIGNSGTDFTSTGGLTLAGTLDANGQVDLGDGGDSITVDGSALTLQTTGAGSDITINAVDQIILTDFTNGGSGCGALTTNASGHLTCGAAGSFTSFTLSGDTGSDQTISDGNTLEVAGGTGIDTAAGATDTITLTFDGTELNDVTFGDNSDASILWTFNQSTGTDPTVAFSNDTIALTAGSTTFSGDITVTGGTVNGATGESLDLGVATADTLTFTVGGATEALLNGTNLTAGTAEGNSLGSATVEWEQLFVGDDNGIAFGLDQDWTFAYDEATDDRLELVTAGASGLLIQSAATTGNGVNLTMNSLTTGSALDVSSTSAATTIADGLLGYFNWAPTSTTATGDLFRINIGSGGNVTNLFNVTDNGSSLFSVAETQITSAIPHQFTAAGDVSMAYDLVFTNQTASTIKANGPLTIDAGETFETDILVLP
jgi:hypothetical protein